MKSACLFLTTAFALAQLHLSLGWEAVGCCYKIQVDGKDRSAYQYVNSHLVTFADPAWKGDPVVDEARLVDVKTGREERAPFFQRANFMPGRLWGGVMFEHIPFGTVLTLRIGTSHVTFERTRLNKACPHPDFRLDDRQNGYEVLQYCPYEVYRSRGPLGSHVHLEGPRVILKTNLLFTECSATLNRVGAVIGNPFPIQGIAGSGLLDRYPHLAKPIKDEWGLLFTYLVFPALNQGDELKVVVSLPGGSQQPPFYVRKIESGAR